MCTDTLTVIKIKVNKCLSSYSSSGCYCDSNSPYIFRYMVGIIHEVYI